MGHNARFPVTGTRLTGRQGVMIPQANVKDLMLRPEVVEAQTYDIVALTEPENE